VESLPAFSPRRKELAAILARRFFRRRKNAASRGRRVGRPNWAYATSRAPEGVPESRFSHDRPATIEQVEGVGCIDFRRRRQPVGGREKAIRPLSRPASEEKPGGAQTQLLRDMQPGFRLIFWSRRRKLAGPSPR